MMRTIWLLTLGTLLSGCGSGSGDSSTAGQFEDDESEWLDDVEDTVDTGSLSISLPGDHGTGEATCSLNIMRAVEKRLASVSFTLDVVGEGCDGMGNCSNPDMRFGQLTYNGGVDGDRPFATMILNYEPPGDGDEELLWMYNAIFKSEPFSRFSMSVDGAPFDVVTSDTRGAENYADGPHLWNTRIDIEADMLQSTDLGDQAKPGIQTRGEFSYDGVCEVFAKYIQL